MATMETDIETDIETMFEYLDDRDNQALSVIVNQINNSKIEDELEFISPLLYIVIKIIKKNSILSDELDKLRRSNEAILTMFMEKEDGLS